MTDLQHSIMDFIVNWVKQQKSPVPRREIFQSMSATGVAKHLITTAIESLIRKGYIRRSSSFSKYTSYIQLRGI